MARMVEREPDRAAERPAVAPVAPPIADPAPLGLGAFALTTFVLSVINAKIIGVEAGGVVLGLALAYGGIAQVLAGMWEFRNNNTFGAVAFTSYGAFWISYWALVHFYAGTLGAEAGNAIGLYLIAWGIFTAYMTVAALRVSVAVLTVLVLLTATYFLLGIGSWAGYSGLGKWGGYVGIATAAAAWYTSMAIVVASTFGRYVLPVIPLRRPLGD